MTDRHAAYVVTLSGDVREDDASAIIQAIEMIRGVLSVRPVVADIALHIAEERANEAWRERLLDVVRESRTRS